MFESHDIIIRQIQQFVARLLRQAVDLMQIPTQGDMTMILEELSGLEMGQLQNLGEETVVYLLKLRAGGELRPTLIQALRLQAQVTPDEPRWERLAAALESEA